MLGLLKKGLVLYSYIAGYFVDDASSKETMSVTNSYPLVKTNLPFVEDHGLINYTSPFGEPSLFEVPLLILEPQIYFDGDISDDNHRFFTASVLAEDSLYSLATMAEAVVSYIPYILIASKNPLLGVGFLAAHQVISSQAKMTRDIYPEANDITNIFKTEHMKFTSHDVSKNLLLQDVTDDYRGRHLQDITTCKSSIVPVDAWALALGGVAGDSGSALALSPDGTVMVAGYTVSFGAGGYDVLLAQFSANGIFEWAKTIGGTSDEIATALVHAPDGSMVVTGYTTNFGNRDVLLVRVHANGTLAWVKSIGGGSDDYGGALALRPDGRVVVTGYTQSFGAGNADVLLAQFYANGTLEWARTMGGASDEAGVDIVLSADGSMVLTGYTNSVGFGYKDALLARIYANGTLAWIKSIGGSSDDENTELVLRADGRILTVGYSTSFSTGDADVLLMQFDTSGNIEWSKTFGGNFDDKGSALALRSDGHVVVTGYTQSFGIGWEDILLAQFDINGDLEWFQTFGGASGDYGFALALLSNNQLVVTGSMTYGAGNIDLLFAQFSLENDIPSLASDLRLTKVANSSIKLLNISDHLVQMNWTSVSSQAIAMIQRAWTSPTYSDIPISKIVPFSLVMNTSAFTFPTDPVLTYKFDYMLPVQPFLYLSAQPKINVDVGSSDWLSYDSTRGVLSGTPLKTTLGQQSIKLLPDAIFIPNAGLSLSEIQIDLCIRPSKTLNTSTWLEVFGGNAADLGASLAFRPDGRVVAMGFTNSFGAGNHDFLLAQFYENGTMEWAKAVGGVGDDYGNMLALCPDGRVLMVGSTSSFGAGSADIGLIQFDEKGGFQWAKTLGGAGADFAYAIATYSDCSAVVTGFTNSFSAGNFDVLLAKFNANGTVQWANAFGGATDDRGLGLTLSPNGQIFVTGYTGSFGAGSADALLMKFYTNGTLEWLKTIGGALDEFGLALSLRPNGKIVVTGRTSSFGAGLNDIFLVQLYMNGTLEWAKAMGGVNDDYAFALALRSDGSAVLTGYTESFGAGSRDLLLGQFDVNGNLEWVKTLGGISGDSGFALAIRPDGRLLVVGSTQSFGAGSDDLLLLQLTATGDTSEADIFIQPVFNAQVFTIAPSVATVNSGLISTVFAAATVNWTDASVISAALSFDILSSNFFQMPLLPVQFQIFGQKYLLNLNNYLYSGVSILRLNELNKVLLPFWLKYDPFAKILSGTPTGTVRGEYYIDMNLQHLGQKQEITFIINVPNTPPYYIGNVTFNTPTGRFVFPIGAAFKDNETDRLFPFSLDLLNGELPPPIASIDSISGRLFGTTLSGDQGSYQFNVTATDPYNGLGWAVITVNVVNTAPSLQYVFANPDPVNVGQLFQYNFPSNAFADHDGDPINYEAACPLFLSFNPSTRTLSGISALSDRGLHAVYFFAVDPYGGRSNVSIIVDVNAIPVQQFDLSTLTLTPVNVPYAYSLPFGLYMDPEGDVVSYQLTEDISHIKPAWLNFNSSSFTLSGTPLSNTHQSIPIRFTVSDGRGGTTFYDVLLNIPNSAPVLGAGISGQVIAVNQVKTLVIANAVFYDADEDSLIYQLEQADGTSLPDWISVATNVINFVPRSGAQGVYTLRLIADDGYGGETNTSFVVSIPNRNPEKIESLPGMPIVTAGNTLSYSFASSVYRDPDGDVLTYSAQIPRFLQFDGNTRILSGSPLASDRGSHEIMLIATDPYGGQINTTMFIIINGVPVRQLNISTLMLNYVNVGFSYQLPLNLYVDPDGDAISYELTNDVQHIVPSWLTFNAATQTLSGTPTDNAHRALPIRFQVSDGRGGVIFYDLSLSIPNSAPNQVYPIPTPADAKSQIVWNFAFDADNFADADHDPLIYSAKKADGSALPSWIGFNSVRRSFAGTPTGADRGVIPLMIQVSDGLGSISAGYFNVSVINSAPVAEGRVFDQQVSGTESSFIFTVPAFDDADGDAVTYSAEMLDGSALPSWIHFDASTRTFTSSPKVAAPGNYPINLIATDALGLSQRVSFNLAIQAPPTIDLGTNSTTDILKSTAPALGGGGLLLLITSMLLGRQRRIRDTNRRVRKWSTLTHARVTPSTELVEFASLSRDLTAIGTQLAEAAALADIESKLMQFEQKLRLYYAQDIKHEPMTTLLDSLIVEKLMKFVERNVLETHHKDYDSERTFGAARLLHSFLGMILSEHTGRKHKLSQETKELYLNRLNKLISRLNSRGREAIEVLYELHSAREALICTSDTNTLFLLCKASVTHILSPGALLKDLKRLAFDIPSNWYLLLLELTIQAAQAKTDIGKLTELQSIAAKQTDWRFLYGMISVLLNIIANTTDPSIRTQAIKGQNRACGIALLGLIQILQTTNSWLCCHQNTWVRRQAKWALNEAGVELRGTDRELLGPYLTATPMSRPARKSMITTPLDALASTRQEGLVRRVVAVAEDGAVAVSNPLHDGRSVATMWMDTPLSAARASVVSITADDALGLRTVSSPLRAIRINRGDKKILTATSPEA